MERLTLLYTSGVILVNEPKGMISSNRPQPLQTTLLVSVSIGLPQTQSVTQ